MKVVIPTPLQVLLAVMGSLAFLIFTQFDRFLALLGIGDVALNAAGSAVHTRFEAILTSQVAASAALVTFWATIGLIAYLICWSVYNVLIEARNEVTLNTQYTNRGMWRAHFETLGIKLICAALLLLLVYLLKAGLALYVALWLPLLAGFDTSSVVAALGAVLGLAVHLYAILVAAMLTITPWYRSDL
jgi:hypothetical protein